MILFTFSVILFCVSPCLGGVTRTDLPDVPSLGDYDPLQVYSDDISPRWGLGLGQAISGATNSLGSITSGIKDVATNAIDKAKDTATSAVSGATSAVDKAKETAANAVGGAASVIDKAKETVSSGAASAIDKAKETATSAVSGAASAIDKAKETVSNGAASAIDKAKETAASAVGGAAGAIDKAKETASNAASGALEAAKGVASGAVDKIKDVAGSVVDLALRATEKALNAGVDVFLKTYKTVVKTLKMDEIALPPVIEAPYYVASFKANNGFFKSLTSLSKDGDITVRRNGTTISLLVPLRFDDMEAGYANYSVAALSGWLKAEGSLAVAIKSNKVRLGLSLNLSTKCALSLDEIAVGDLDGIDIKFTGVCSYCEWMISKASTFMTNFFQSTIKNLIQDKLHSTMNTVLSENSAICGKFLTG